MIAYVTTVGEPTTDLCVWSLKRNGFEVHTVSGNTTLAEKLKLIYEAALYTDQDFLRIDADVIVNKDCNKETILKAQESHPNAWWIQFQCWGWYSQKLIYGGIQYYKKDSLPILMKYVDSAQPFNRPETYLSRVREFYEPRRFESHDLALGIHGYGIKDLKPIAKQKAERGQSHNYDFELAEKLNALA